MKLSTLAAVAVGVLVLGVIGGTGEAEEPERPDDGAERPRIAQDQAPDRADPTRDGRPDREPDPSPEPRPQVRTYVVTHVVDGDTVDLGNGETVRLVGIDTPETGECGHEKASDALAGLVLGRTVRLVRSDEDRDRYGRLLRYVDVGRVDAGLRLVEEGLAVARYDSRDGYGFHPREPRYVAADRASQDVACSTPRGFVGSPGGSDGGGCAPGYSPCVPVYPPDVDCPDVDGPVRVSGSDPHGLDADGDGTACE